MIVVVVVVVEGKEQRQAEGLEGQLEEKQASEGQDWNTEQVKKRY